MPKRLPLQGFIPAEVQREPERFTSQPSIMSVVVLPRQGPPCRGECSTARLAGSVKSRPTGPAEGGPAGVDLTWF